MVVVLAIAVSAGFGSAEALTEPFQGFAGEIGVSSLGMPWHLILVFLKATDSQNPVPPLAKYLSLLLWCWWRCYESECSCSF